MSNIKSNIQRGYETETGKDGSVNIQYLVPKISNRTNASGVISLLMVVAGIFSGLVVAAITDIKLLGWIVGIASVFFLFKLGNKAFAPKKQEIIVIPNDGIKSGSIQLAISDIQSIGSSSEKGAYGFVGYVYANAFGREVRLSGLIDSSLAEGIAAEIRGVLNGISTV